MKVLYLLGSGKPHGQSTSEALARYLHGRIGAAGRLDSAFHCIELKRALHPGVEIERLLKAVTDCDLLVLASPIYVDALPYPVVNAFEVIAGERLSSLSPRRFVAIVNCGFPEAAHCALALRMCQVFSRKTGLEWAGGLALGGGEAIRGRALEKAGGPARKPRKALDLAARALADGQPIPVAAVKLMASPSIPGFAYRLIGSLGWKLRARRLGTTTPLDAKPYQKE
jgi:hypothetical protein